MKTAFGLTMAALFLVGTATQARADVEFSIPNRLAKKCDLISPGDGVRVFIEIEPGEYPQHFLHYYGWMDGVTSDGVPVLCRAAISSTNRGLAVDVETVVTPDGCELTNFKTNGNLVTD